MATMLLGYCITFAGCYVYVYIAWLYHHTCMLDFDSDFMNLATHAYASNQLLQQVNRKLAITITKQKVK